MSRLFISYRRKDSADVAGRMYDHLLRHFSRDDLFKDVDSIGLGVDFRQAIADAVGSCDVVLAVIGPSWTEARDDLGRERLADPDDFVRIELETGLERGIPVIPVLVGGAAMPGREALPAPLQPLVYRNALALRPDPDFTGDMQRLVRALREILVAKAVGPVRRAPSRTLGAQPGPRRRLLVYAVLAFLVIGLATAVYRTYRAAPHAGPVKMPDPCDRPDPPASCLFQ